MVVIFKMLNFILIEKLKVGNFEELFVFSFYKIF